jgi:heme-degrading monooxygenase HmoA
MTMGITIGRVGHVGTLPNTLGRQIARPLYDSSMDAEAHVVCIFRSTRTEHSTEEYEEWSHRMDRLVVTMPGYMGHVSFHDDSSRTGITVSYFRSMHMLEAWREMPEHRAAQALGRSRFYEDYEIEVAEIVRHYEWTATETTT